MLLQSVCYPPHAVFTLPVAALISDPSTLAQKQSQSTNRNDTKCCSKPRAGAGGIGGGGVVRAWRVLMLAMPQLVHRFGLGRSVFRSAR
jgi:hypothetical protein